MFDTATRNKLASFVANARKLLCGDYNKPGGEITSLLQTFGIQPDGAIADLDQVPGLDQTGYELGHTLRDILAHKHAQSHDKKTWGKYDAAVYDLLQEQSFTVLNRLCALRMAEERGIILPCVSQGINSDSFLLYEQITDKTHFDRDTRYQHFLFSLFDELAIDLGVLFDRFSPHSLLFPRPVALNALLELLNDRDLAPLWSQDETIGWIYQYWNSKEERKAMRDASAAPRNSRELAVRNQFFTPRYVVEFLTDNTLGRIWYEMCQGQTQLAEQCRYLVRRPTEIFLAEGENATEVPSDQSSVISEEALTQEQLLKQPVHIPHRPLKDPREIRLLDPACGSMHFGLYAFDLFETIYSEAWDLLTAEGGTSSTSHSALGTRHSEQPLTDLYASKAEFMRDVPRLIIEHNIHGIDIDPRAVQIAGLSLWLRAQKAWKDIPAAERPRVRRSNIVCAEPMPGSDAMLEDFVKTLDPPLLGELVKTVFDKMQLAGEAGSLLKIEEEIRSAIEEAKKSWEKLGSAGRHLFSVEELNKTLRAGTQQELTGIEKALTTDLRPLTSDFWESAEERVISALKSYAEQADTASYQRRLFAEDAARGFAFIDLCRKRYDAVVMNPPFGRFSKLWVSQSKLAYPNSANDILGAFVERFLHSLHGKGRLGAITSRTCFFLTTFNNWRQNVVLKESAVQAIADLGQGVMDEAMVEAAAYVLERTHPTSNMTVFRAIADADRQRALEACLEAHQAGKSESRLFLAHQQTFDLLPDSPFVYWINDETIRQFNTGVSLDPAVAAVRQGLSTSDNYRFVRTVWEVSPQDTIFCYYPSNGDLFCSFDDPIVQAYFSRRGAGTPKWAFHVMAGPSQPWYAPITVKVQFFEAGLQLRNFRDSKGKPKGVLRNPQFYHRPGFSWTRRAVRFYPYVVPGNCIPSASRYMAFPDHGMQAEGLAVCASRLVSAFLRFYAEFWQRPNFLVDTLKALPWPELPDEAKVHFEELIGREVEQRRLSYQNHEPFHEFLLPGKIRDFSNDGQSLAFDADSLLDAETEKMVADAFGFTEEQARAVERDLLEAISYQQVGGATGEEDDEENAGSEAEGEEADSDFVLDFSKVALEEANLSYLLGTAFGRWEIRYATGERQPPELSHPFDPLPVCPPGMLQNAEALPAEPKDVPTDYPLRITWSGILVDDENHPEDIVTRTRDALKVIWPGNWESIEREACEILGVKELRQYFAEGKSGSKFFADHLSRYSKSRRQAPIYWPLSTASGSYTLWLYYHRLTHDTLYAAVSQFVEPRIEQAKQTLARLHEKGDARTKQEDKTYEQTQQLIGELATFREELLRIAGFWKPNLNDGVQITAAPLWSLFRLRTWQAKLKETWQDLEKGKYDWAHLAYTIWPDRVAKACETDRSIAIAHGLEHLCKIEPPKAKKAARKKAKGKAAAEEAEEEPELIEED